MFDKHHLHIVFSNNRFDAVIPLDGNILT